MPASLTMLKSLFTSIVLLVAADAHTAETDTAPLSVLFVGNSLTYTNNLPLFLEKLAATQGKSIDSEMLVSGGATISEKLNDHSLAAAVQQTPADYIVLQEKGGELFCAATQNRRTEPACRTLINNYQAAKKLGDNISAGTIILGTYQFLQEANYYLIEAEQWLSQETNSAYVNVANPWAYGRETMPGFKWLHADGGHPGKDLTLLMSILLYKELLDDWPVAMDFVIEGPVYAPNQRFNGERIASQQTLDDLSSNTTIRIAEERVQTLIDIAKHANKNPMSIPSDGQSQ